MMPGNEGRVHLPSKQVMHRQITAKLLMATAVIASSALHETIQPRAGIAQAHIPPVYEWCNAYYKPSENGLSPYTLKAGFRSRKEDRITTLDGIRELKSFMEMLFLDRWIAQKQVI